MLARFTAIGAVLVFATAASVLTAPMPARACMQGADLRRAMQIEAQERRETDRTSAALERALGTLSNAAAMNGAERETAAAAILRAFEAATNSARMRNEQRLETAARERGQSAIEYFGAHPPHGDRPATQAITPRQGFWSDRERVAFRVSLEIAASGLATGVNGRAALERALGVWRNAYGEVEADALEHRLSFTRALIEHGAALDALAMLTEMRARWPHESRVFSQTGSALERAGLMAEAAGAFRAASELNPAGHDSEERVHALLAWHRHLVVAQPDAAARTNVLGLELSAGNLAQAEADLTRMLILAPGYAPAEALLLEVRRRRNGPPVRSVAWPAEAAR